MSETKRPAPDSRRAPFDTEIHTRAIVHFLVWLVVGVVIVVVGIRLLESRFERQARQADLPPSPLVDRTQHRVPPEPRLQPAPQVDLQRYLDEERRRVANWGWVDEKAGVVHIPVERAMDILAARGLPARPQPGTTLGSGTVAPSLTPAPTPQPVPAVPFGGQP
jgi:hypothetical protein